MATQKPISTISYNTEPFLKEHLDAWLDAHIIQSYQYICHKGEDGDKDHIHLRLEPNKKLDVMDLAEQLREFQIGSDKPLGCRPFRPSKEEDWFLYAVHDEEYLKLKYGGAEKGEKLPYDWTDIRVPDFYDAEVAWIRAKASLKHSSVNMATRMQRGDDAMSLILEGNNPYLVSSILRTLTHTDYEKTARELQFVKFQLSTLARAIQDNGFAIRENDDGSLSIEKDEVFE